MGDERTIGCATPVVLFAYRRHRQIARTLECLRAAGARRLYMFSDGPADEQARADVELVRRQLRAVDWAETELFPRERNVGLSASIGGGLNLVFERHETAIVIEDDVFVAPEFCAYAERALDHYAGDPRVAGITGLRYPFDRRALQGYGYDVFLSPRFSSWGWATWAERWRELTLDAAELRRRIAATPGFDPAPAGADMAAMIHDAILTESLGGSWDVACATSMLLAGSGFITPTWNMVENGGLEEGTHTNGPSALELAWEPETAPPIDGLRFAPPVPDERILAAYRGSFDVGGGPLARVAGRRAGRRALRRLRAGSG